MTIVLSAGGRVADVPAACWPAIGGKLKVVELLIAVNPDRDSKLPYLLRLPLAGGMVFRTSGTWPRTKTLYCYPVPAEEWPDHPPARPHIEPAAGRGHGGLQHAGLAQPGGCHHEDAAAVAVDRGIQQPANRLDGRLTLVEPDVHRSSSV